MRSQLLILLSIPALADADPVERSTAPNPPRDVAWTREVAIGANLSRVPNELDHVLGAVGYLGLGKFVTRHLALMVRLAGSYGETRGDSLFTVTAGVHAQIWLGDHGWLSGGAGFGVAGGCDFGECVGGVGFPVEARAGYALSPRGRGGLNASMALSRIGGGIRVDGVSLLIGYQGF